MTNRHEFPLSEAISEMLKTYKLDGKLLQVKAIESWPRVVGPVIARHTVHIQIERKTLFVRLDSDVLRNELLYAKSLIIKNINKEVNSDLISEIVFS